MTESAAGAVVEAAPHPVLTHFAGLRDLLQLVHADRARERIERALAEFERDLIAALKHCHHHHGHGGDTRPASITLTATSQGATMGTYAPGATIDLTADVKNAEQQDITDAVTWNTTAGTITPDAANPLKATLTGAPLGDTTVTATTSNGIAAEDTVTVADQTPASITVTDSAAA